MDWLNAWSDVLRSNPMADQTLRGVGLLLVAWLADLLTRRLLVRAVARLLRATPFRWDDGLIERGVIQRLAKVVPAVVIYVGIGLMPELPAGFVTVVRNVAVAYMVLTLALAGSALLALVDDVYRGTPRGRERPIKGYLQVAKILLFVVAGVLMVAVLSERSPLLLLSGLGALGAVVMLVFKDTILSLVASVQLSSNDMLRVGDWVEMPQLGADGDVIDVALHTVKVQNWDKTITTIPTHRLISDSFRNWRGMSESGGRRIKRALQIDQTSVRYFTPDERDALGRFDLLGEYIAQKQVELKEFNQRLLAAGKDAVNTRRLTNIGSFRAYVEAYLRHHPQVHQEMTLLVRQLPPTPAGLPIELYCFTSTTDWGVYEAVQSDIFDHLLAIVPEFGLRVFQQPSGADIARGAQLLADLQHSQSESATQAAH